jgi:acyl-CoA reductase-like NAD-dependent aldehyde dehydrogenase
MGRLDGKVAFITGVARGQGRSHAAAMAAEGADIVGIDICAQLDTVSYPMATSDDLEETIALIEKLGRRMVARRSDVRDLGAVRSAVEEGVLVGVDNSMEIVREEVFGPVGVIVSFDDEDEAVRIANDSNFGLSGGVWSADSANAYAIARRLRTGTVSVNGGAGGINPDATFGGYKHSGLGREFGAHGIPEFLEHKAVTWPVATG